MRLKEFSKIELNRKEISNHVKSYIECELKMCATYQALSEELKHDLEEIEEQYRCINLSTLGGGISENTMVEVIAMQKEVVESKIKDLEWRVRKIERGLTLLNEEQRKIVNYKVEGYLSHENIIDELGYGRKRFYEMLYDIHFKIGVMLGVMPPT